jgi:4-hydroxy-3-methylbut-2-en-1-yl diphosphate reductase
MATATLSPIETAEKRVVLLRPRGFCAGVVRAIDVVKISLEIYGAPIYVRREIVHNRHVVEDLRNSGAVFVTELDEVPSGERVVFSAHGVSPAVREQAKARGLKVIDATCPLVTKVHLEVIKFARQGFTVLLIGHKSHEEVEGTMGEAPNSVIVVETVDDALQVEVPDPSKVCYTTQTTLSLDETRDIVDVLQQRFPQMVGPKSQDICYATENRQLAVKAIANQIDLLLVIGSQNSSNSKRLVEVSRGQGVDGYLIDDFSEVKSEWLQGKRSIGVTAGASAPENLVADLIGHLKNDGGFQSLEEYELKEEDVRFSLPNELNILK